MKLRAKIIRNSALLTLAMTLIMLGVCRYVILQVSGVMALAVLVFGAVFGFVAVRSTTRDVLAPVERINSLIQRFTSEKPFTERLEVRGRDEIACLTRQVNRMLDGVQESQQRLMAARERLQYEATHDSLTGTWNRAAAMELLDRELARSDRERISVAVIMFDADRFKRVNDCFGHSVGDGVLQNIAAVISRNLRSFDVLARYGGEEFLVIAPNCTNMEAQALSERILHRLEETPVHVCDQDVSITMSAGVASGALPYTSEELIDAADIALYRAKANGRNCVECEELSSEGRPRRKMFAIPRRIM